jgi:membrane protein
LLTAAALSFFGLLSLIPMLLVAVAALGYFVDSRTAQVRVIDFVQDFLPSLSDAPVIQQKTLQFLREIMNGFARGPKEATAVIGLIGFFWSASSIFLNMEVAFNDMLGVTHRRSYLRSRLVAFQMVLFVGALFVGSIGITSAARFLQGWSIAFPPFVASGDFQPGRLPLLWQCFGFLVPVVLSFLMFFTIYRRVPNACIQWRAAFAGAAFASVAFEIAKRSFGWYAGHAYGISRVYGAVGWLFLMVIWTLFAFTLLNLGAEIADVYSDVVLREPIVEAQSKE